MKILLHFLYVNPHFICLLEAGWAPEPEKRAHYSSCRECYPGSQARSLVTVLTGLSRLLCYTGYQRNRVWVCGWVNGHNYFCTFSV